MRPLFYNLAAFRLGLAAAQMLPRSAAHAIGLALGRVGYARNETARTALRANLRRVTQRNGAALDALCARNVDQFSRMMADYFACAGDEEKANSLLDQWRGFENLEAALARGKGVVLVTAHLGHWEMGGALLTARGLKMTVITLEEPTSELTRWREEQRRRLGIKTIAVGPGHDFAFVEMIQTLRRNEILAMLVDRPYEGTGTDVQFFGATTQFSTGPALLFQHTGAAVVPAFVLLNERGKYTSFADPMLPLDPGRDALAANTQRIATHFESVIREHPEQWFNYVPIWNS